MMVSAMVSTMVSTETAKLRSPVRLDGAFFMRAFRPRVYHPWPLPPATWISLTTRAKAILDSFVPKKNDGARHPTPAIVPQKLAQMAFHGGKPVSGAFPLFFNKQ
jgi:hypothetical protein